MNKQLGFEEGLSLRSTEPPEAASAGVRPHHAATGLLMRKGEGGDAVKNTRLKLRSGRHSTRDVHPSMPWTCRGSTCPDSGR